MEIAYVLIITFWNNNPRLVSVRFDNKAACENAQVVLADDYNKSFYKIQNPRVTIGMCLPAKL